MGTSDNFRRLTTAQAGVLQRALEQIARFSDAFETDDAAHANNGRRAREARYERGTLSQTIVLHGDRGTGKSTTLYDLRSLLNDQRDPPKLADALDAIRGEVDKAQWPGLETAFNRIHRAGTRQQFRPAFCLPVIDPSRFEADSTSLMEQIFAVIDNELSVRLDDPEDARSRLRQEWEVDEFAADTAGPYYDAAESGAARKLRPTMSSDHERRLRGLRNRLRDDVARGWTFAQTFAQDVLSRDVASYDDYVQSRAKESAIAAKRHRRWAELLNGILDQLRYRIIAIFIDDFDLTPEHVGDVLRTLRLYLRHPRIVVVISANLLALRDNYRADRWATQRRGAGVFEALSRITGIFQAVGEPDKMRDGLKLCSDFVTRMTFEMEENDASFSKLLPPHYQFHLDRPKPLEARRIAFENDSEGKPTYTAPSWLTRYDEVLKTLTLRDLNYICDQRNAEPAWAAAWGDDRVIEWLQATTIAQHYGMASPVSAVRVSRSIQFNLRLFHDAPDETDFEFDVAVEPERGKLDRHSFGETKVPDDVVEFQRRQRLFNANLVLMESDRRQIGPNPPLRIVRVDMRLTDELRDLGSVAATPEEAPPLVDHVQAEAPAEADVYLETRPRSVDGLALDGATRPSPFNAWQIADFLLIARREARRRSRRPGLADPKTILAVVPGLRIRNSPPLAELASQGLDALDLRALLAARPRAGDPIVYGNQRNYRLTELRYCEFFRRFGQVLLVLRPEISNTTDGGFQELQADLLLNHCATELVAGLNLYETYAQMFDDAIAVALGEHVAAETDWLAQPDFIRRDAGEDIAAFAGDSLAAGDRLLALYAIAEPMRALLLLAEAPAPEAWRRGMQALRDMFTVTTQSEQTSSDRRDGSPPAAMPSPELLAHRMFQRKDGPDRAKELVAGTPDAVKRALAEPPFGDEPRAAGPTEKYRAAAVILKVPVGIVRRAFDNAPL